LKKNTDPPKVRSLAVRSTTDGLTKKQRERQQRLEQQQKLQAQKPKTISIERKNFNVDEIFTEEKRAVRFAQGMGIKKIELNRRTNKIEFELEPEFDSVLQTICSWKQIQPEIYLSQLLMEYLLSVQEKKKKKLN
jgi:hypothetical protein